MAIVAATFFHRAAVNRAIEDLKTAGIDPKNIPVAKRTRRGTGTSRTTRALGVLTGGGTTP